MPHNIALVDGRHSMAFTGERRDIWHSLGQQLLPGQPLEVWAKAAGLGWDAIKVPAIANLVGPEFDHIPASERFRQVPERVFVARSDNGYPLGYVSDGWQPVQPIDTLKWVERYISVDDRFQLDTAGALKNGEIIWALASFKDTLPIDGEAHKAYLLMTTSFDGTAST